MIWIKTILIDPYALYKTPINLFLTIFIFDPTYEGHGGYLWAVWAEM